jgi:hypothetical protein
LNDPSQAEGFRFEELKRLHETGCPPRSGVPLSEWAVFARRAGVERLPYLSERTECLVAGDQVGYRYSDDDRDLNLRGTLIRVYRDGAQYLACDVEWDNGLRQLEAADRLILLGG